jgi:ABC-2 type transport system ATP-binding protein
METLLDARDLYRYYGRRCAVAGLSLRLARGEVLGLLGPNGAGKSTSLRMLSGILSPSAGQVMLGGTNLWRRPRQAKTQLGYLPERLPLYPELRVDEYLGYCARLHRVPRRRVRVAVDEAKQRCGLQETGRRLIANLSRGYRQRLGIAQAIVHRPQVVILDEPTLGLDPNQVREVRALIRDLAMERGLILSSHILPEVQSVCTRVEILHQGRQVYSAVLDRDATPPLLLGLERPPVPEALERLPGVAEVQSLPGGRFRLQLQPGSDPRSAIAQAAVESGWGLLQLQREERDLERIFVELTSGEPPCLS